jgi:hypothetical protein
VNTMAVRLRLGPLSRSPHNQRGPKGTAETGLPLPWQNYSHLHAVPDDCRDQSGERSFAALRERAFSSSQRSPPPPADKGADGTLKAIEGAADVAMLSGAGR